MCGHWFVHEHCIRAQLMCGQRASSGVSLQKLQCILLLLEQILPLVWNFCLSVQQLPEIHLPLCSLSLKAAIPGFAVSLALHQGCRDLSSSRLSRRVFWWLSCTPAPVTVPDLNPPPAETYTTITDKTLFSMMNTPSPGQRAGWTTPTFLLRTETLTASHLTPSSSSCVGFA